MSYFFLFLFIVIPFFGCKKDNSLQVPSSEATSLSQSDIECDEEADGILNTAALGIVELSQDTSFRSLVHSKVTEQFDDDDNVLLMTLSGLVSNLAETMRQSVVQYKDSIELSPNLINYKTFQTFTTTEKLNATVMGYSSCLGMLYTQIYVPFFKEVNLNSVPVIVIGYDEPDDCIVPGYQIKSNGEVKVINVDEAFAQQNLVWVISFNERVNENAIVYSNVLADDNDQSSENSADFRSVDKWVKVKKILIKDKKECWICGKADVSFASLQAKGCQIQGNAFHALKFVKIGNSDLNEWIDIPSSNGLSYMALGPENPLNQNECIGFVLYEKDSARKRWQRSWTHSTCPSSGSVTLFYTSKDTPYGGSGISQYCYSAFANTSFFTELPVQFSWPDAEMRLEGKKVN